MLRKIYILIFASLALVHTAPTPGEKLDADTLVRNLVKYYFEMVDELFTIVKKANEPIFKDLANNKFTTNKRLEEKITELKIALEKIAIPETINCSNWKLFNKSYQLRKIGQICDELAYINAETESASIFNTVHDAIESDAVISLDRFADKSLQDLEKHWNGLSTKEQEEQQDLADIVADIKSKNTLLEKIQLLDLTFNYKTDIVKVLSYFVPSFNNEIE